MSKPFVLYTDESLQTPLANQPAHVPGKGEHQSQRLYVACTDPSARFCEDSILNHDIKPRIR